MSVAGRRLRHRDEPPDLDDPARFRFLGQESYVKSEAEMGALFPDHPEVLAETARVAARCEFGGALAW